MLCPVIERDGRFDLMVEIGNPNASEIFGWGWRKTGRRISVNSYQHFFEKMEVVQGQPGVVLGTNQKYERPILGDLCHPDQPGNMTMWLFEETGDVVR